MIEHVRDGCTVRAFLLPDFQYVTIMLAGIKAPMVKQDGTVEPHAAEAKYAVESNLLQRDVEIILEGVSNQNILGTVLHPVSVVYATTCNIYGYHLSRHLLCLQLPVSSSRSSVCISLPVLKSGSVPSDCV